MTNELYHHGILGQKWGKRNGPPYPLDSDGLAKEIATSAKEKEPKISKSVIKAVKSAGASMYGFENRLKTRESIKRKIETDSEEKNISISKAASEIKDAVRYTCISDDDSFTSTYNKVKNALSDSGYTETRCRNYFDEYRKGTVKHKSVQSIFTDKDGYNFELQFHTKSSQDAKNKKIPLYEERRKPGLSLERQKELEKQMSVLAERVPDPKDVYSIISHSDELYHHGILGQRWGQTNGPPYPLDAEDRSMSEKKAMRMDKRWVKKNDKKIRKYATNATRSAMKEYVKNDLNLHLKKYNKTGKMSQQYIIAYNKQLANLMNQSIEGLEAPSGRVVKFIAKRGNIGVYTALADKGYDLNQLRQGVYSSGKVAYRKSQVDMDYGDSRRRR